MKRHLQFYLIVILAIALFDLVASLASRILMFDYTNLSWVSGCLYSIAGFVGCKRLGFLGGIVAALPQKSNSHLDRVSTVATILSMG